MKALKILKDITYHKIDGTPSLHGNCSIDDVYEAIEELEFIQLHSTCEACIYDGKNGFGCQSVSVCKRVGSRSGIMDCYTREPTSQLSNQSRYGEE